MRRELAGELAAAGGERAKYLKALQDAERYGIDGPFLLIHARGWSGRFALPATHRSVILRPAALAAALAVLVGGCGDGRPMSKAEGSAWHGRTIHFAPTHASSGADTSGRCRSGT
jgi:hypothetical protein